MKKITTTAMALLMSVTIAGCAGTNTESSSQVINLSEVGTTQTESNQTESNQTSTVTNVSSSGETAVVTTTSEGSMLDVSDMFTDRDLEQTADLSEAITITLESDSEMLISEEGVYVFTGDVTNTVIKVEADDEAKVQIVLDGVNIVNDNQPAIYVVSGDKVFVTTTDSVNYMEVTGSYVADGDTNLDAVIYSKSDLVLNGIGTLDVVSAEGNGITSKDDLKITGGVLNVDANLDGLEANDSVRIYDGEITIVSDKDAIHSENDEDTTLGYIYIQDGTLNITAADDAIRGTSIVQIDGGTINIETCVEGIEGTYVQINGGTFDIYSTDDGINATAKSDYDVVIEINGGDITIVMANGDTDAIDSNGDIFVNDGTINITAGSSFDADSGIELNGGIVTVNGEVVTDVTSIQSGRGGSKGTKNRG